MTIRTLRHGSFGTTQSVGLEPGAWTDVSAQGQFLIDLEFLVQHGPPSGTGSCVYCKHPSYLSEIAAQFPWIHFFVFDHKPAEGSDYDPEQPLIMQAATRVEANTTVTTMEFTKDMARTMGERGERERESLLMISHGQDPMRQLALHVLMRPHYSLLDICGTIPTEYLDGELILPMFIPNNKVFVALAVHQHAKCKAYDRDTFTGEMGFFQGVIRVTQAYDNCTRDTVAWEYARHTQEYYRCPPEIIKAAVLWTTEQLAN